MPEYWKRLGEQDASDLQIPNIDITGGVVFSNIVMFSLPFDGNPKVGNKRPPSVLVFSWSADLGLLAQ